MIVVDISLFSLVTEVHVYMIVLEEKLMLSPDFLSFLAQCTPVIDKDDSLIGVTAFNFFCKYEFRVASADCNLKLLI